MTRAANTCSIAAMGTIRILNHTGDTRVQWATDDRASVARAIRLFGDQQRRGVAFARTGGQPAAAAHIITEFDPSAEEIIFTRPVAGG